MSDTNMIADCHAYQKSISLIFMTLAIIPGSTFSTPLRTMRWQDWQPRARNGDEIIIICLGIESGSDGHLVGQRSTIFFPFFSLFIYCCSIRWDIVVIPSLRTPVLLMAERRKLDQSSLSRRRPLKNSVSQCCSSRVLNLVVLLVWPCPRMQIRSCQVLQVYKRRKYKSHYILFDLRFTSSFYDLFTLSVLKVFCLDCYCWT